MSATVGTAGHIDHGKTSLVRALTGVETDRLPEEKKRGITIALGFAPLTLPSGRQIGMVDVPGHERFVRTMVAGAVGIDVALLVVAADEGVMPQTREHLEVCGLLGVRRGVVALTKLDKAGPELAELAAADVEETIAGTFLEGAPIVPCSARTGEGLERLREALEATLDGPEPARGGVRFFQPIDRVLSVKGFGTVVTGTALSGGLSTGDEVEYGPGRSRETRARVRSLQAFGQEVTRVSGGQRAAIALAGVDSHEIKVGQALFTPGAAVPTRRIALRLRYLASRAKALKTGARVMLHVGTRAVEAGLTLYGTDAVEPGEESFALGRLREPVVCLPGQRFIIRGFDAPGKAGRTLGGGQILDPEPPRRRRADPAAKRVLARLCGALDSDEASAKAEALAALVSETGARGAQRGALARRLGVSQNRLEKLSSKSPESLVRLAGADVFVTSAAVDALEPAILSAVRQFHSEQALAPGVAPAEVATRVGGLPELVERALKQRIRAGDLVAAPGGLVKDAHFRPAAGTMSAKEAVRAALEAGGLEAPGATELSRTLELQEREVKTVLSALARDGDAVHLGKGLYFGRQAYEEAQRRLVGLAEEEGLMTTARVKEAFGISRKYLIPLLESFDRRGLTIRDGDGRRLRARQP
ncbi:MAG: selenocysteine-specific translation elongation factor [Myxococcota bacterium]